MLTLDSQNSKRVREKELARLTAKDLTVNFKILGVEAGKKFLYAMRCDAMRMQLCKCNRKISF